jgi:hypothetical protein
MMSDFAYVALGYIRLLHIQMCWPSNESIVALLITRDMARGIILPSLFPEMFSVFRTVPQKVEDINRICTLRTIPDFVQRTVQDFNFRNY